MKLNIENLKLEFKEYLIKQGIEPELDKDDELSGASIFAYETEFKDFVEEKYDIDIDSMSFEFNDLLDMDIKDGQFVMPEDENEDEVTQDELMLTMLNALLEDEEFITNLDETQDGKLDNEEIKKFLTYSNELDGKKNELTFKDLVVGVDDANNGNYKVSKETETPQTPSSGGNYYTNPTTNNENKDEVEKNPYSGQDVATLEAKETEEQANFDKSKAEYLSACNGSHEKLVANEENVDNAQNAFTDAIKQQDEALGEQLDEILTKNRDLGQQQLAIEQEVAIIDKELTVQTQIITDSDARIANLNSLKADLNTSLSSIGAEQPDAITSIKAQISQIDAEIAEEEKRKADALTKKQELEGRKTQLDDSLPTIKQELTDLQTQMEAITEQLNALLKDPSILPLYEAYNTAVTNHETLRAQLAASAETNMTTAQTNLQNIRAELAIAHQREDKKAFRATKDEFDPDGEGYIWKDMSTPNNMDLDGDGILTGRPTALTYGAIIPKNADPNEELPLLIMLPGSGEAKGYAEMHQRIYKDIFQNYDQTGLETWNGHILCVNYADVDPSRLPEYLDEIITHYSKQYKIDTDRISIDGYSLGGSRVIYMSSTKASSSSSGSYLNDDVGYKYRNAALITGYQATSGDFDMPVAVFNDQNTALSDSVLSRSTKPKLDLSATGADYWVNTGASHGAVDNDAYTRDDNNNGRADIFEFFEGTLKDSN